MTCGRISIRRTYQLSTWPVVKRAGRLSFHYVARIPMGIFRFIFTTPAVHLLYLAIGRRVFLSWSDAITACPLIARVKFGRI
jgi:hypothetical protein